MFTACGFVEIIHLNIQCITLDWFWPVVYCRIIVWRLFNCFTLLVLDVYCWTKY